MSDGGYNPNGMVEIHKSGFTQIAMTKFIKMPVDALGLHEGTINVLAFNDIFTVQQLAECDEDKVNGFMGIGIVRFEEIKNRLAENGLCFGCVFETGEEPLATACALECGGDSPDKLYVSDDAKAIGMIQEERERQRNKGFDSAHDDTERMGKLAIAASILAMPCDHRTTELVRQWPWIDCQHNFCSHGRTRVSELAKAGALIVAEMGRLMRMEAER